MNDFEQSSMSYRLPTVFTTEGRVLLALLGRRTFKCSLIYRIPSIVTSTFKGFYRKRPSNALFFFKGLLWLGGILKVFYG